MTDEELRCLAREAGAEGARVAIREVIDNELTGMGFDMTPKGKLDMQRNNAYLTDLRTGNKRWRWMVANTAIGAAIASLVHWGVDKFNGVG